MNNLEMKDSITATDDYFKARFLALKQSAHSLTSIRDQLNEGSSPGIAEQ